MFFNNKLIKLLIVNYIFEDFVFSMASVNSSNVVCALSWASAAFSNASLIFNVISAKIKGNFQNISQKFQL